MKQTIIIVDVAGYTQRLDAIRATGYEAIGVAPSDLGIAGFIPITTPDEWLPVNDPTPDDRQDWTELQRKLWHKSNITALAAIQQLDIQSDAYWIIESDCVANVARWKAMFDDHADNAEDVCTTCLSTRMETPGNPRWAITPAWAKFTNLGAIYRMTRAAVEANLAAAVEMREIASEMTYVNVAHRAGLTLGKLNRTTTHYNNQTMKADPSKVILNRRLINHPVKANTFAP